jgi:hypothetical protein
MSLELWTSDPETAYLQWQRAEATGADRRAFAEQPIVQHCSMFSRFHDCVAGKWSDGKLSIVTARSPEGLLISARTC